MKTTSKATEMKHTPAPWHIGMNPGPFVYGPRGELVADLRGESMVPEDEALANQRLIISAPELFAALEEAPEPPCDGDFEAKDGGAEAERIWWANYSLWKERARAAIAKAPGN